VGEVVELECDVEGPQVCFDGFDAQMQGVGDLLVRCGGGVVGGVVERSAQFGQDGVLGGDEVQRCVEGVADIGDTAVGCGLPVVGESAGADPDDISGMQGVASP
jgi:hypothetical protein